MVLHSNFRSFAAIEVGPGAARSRITTNGSSRSIDCIVVDSAIRRVGCSRRGQTLPAKDENCYSSRGISLYRFLGCQPIDLRPLDQSDDLGAALEHLGQRQAVGSGGLRLGQGAIEQNSLFFQLPERSFPPAGPPPQPVGLPPPFA